MATCVLKSIFCFRDHKIRGETDTIFDPSFELCFLQQDNLVIFRIYCRIFLSCEWAIFSFERLISEDKTNNDFAPKVRTVLFASRQFSSRNIAIFLYSYDKLYWISAQLWVLIIYMFLLVVFHIWTYFFKYSDRCIDYSFLYLIVEKQSEF